MKKIIVIGAVFAALSSNAFAKTEGSYLGANILSTSVANEAEFGKTFVSPHTEKKNDSAIGFGANYKYALNFNNVYIAPEVFAEFINSEAKQTNFKVSLNNRYGAKLNLGYDISDKFSAYVTGGIAKVNYETEMTYIGGPGKKKGNKTTAIYGVGFSYSLSKDIALNAEYNRQTLDKLKTSDLDDDVKIKSEINTVKVGIAYHF